ncbi:MAG: hypothetical protein IT162_05735, partial [Bryobacterales bacterium]|nr:hypothetical protein [Bryobacterales bacterium]
MDVVVWCAALARCVPPSFHALLAGVIALPVVLIVLAFASLWYRRIPEPWEPVTWNAATRVFAWHAGQATLPPGFSHEAQHGIDSTVGELHSRDDLVSIHYDIGEWAGEHGLGTGRGVAEQLVGGSRVRMVETAAWFPDSGCANFYLQEGNAVDAVTAIARSFRPRPRHIPAWLRPLLPEVFRSDCRYAC